MNPFLFHKNSIQEIRYRKSLYLHEENTYNTLASRKEFLSAADMNFPPDKSLNYKTSLSVEDGTHEINAEFKFPFLVINPFSFYKKL